MVFQPFHPDFPGIENRTGKLIKHLGTRDKGVPSQSTYASDRHCPQPVHYGGASPAIETLPDDQESATNAIRQEPLDKDSITVGIDPNMPRPDMVRTVFGRWAVIAKVRYPISGSEN